MTNVMSHEPFMSVGDAVALAVGRYVLREWNLARRDATPADDRMGTLRRIEQAHAPDGSPVAIRNVLRVSAFHAARQSALQRNLEIVATAEARRLPGARNSGRRGEPARRPVATELTTGDGVDDSDIWSADADGLPFTVNVQEGTASIDAGKFPRREEEPRV